MGFRLSFAFAACLAAFLPAPAAAADVGVSVNIGQPGFYGRIDIGNVPQPRVIYAQPVIIAPAPVAVVQRPIYLHVPPGHARDWARHCGRYNACSQRTYFVEEDWYRSVYVPARGHHAVQYREAPRHGYRGDRHPAAGGHDRGRGNGHGRGHGKSKGKSRD